MNSPPANDAVLRGKVCLITGATSGIGYVTAKGLAERGGTVLVHGRDPGRTTQAVEQLKAATGNEQLFPAIADLASQSAIRSLAADVLARWPRLDLLINNAGAVYSQRTLTSDGVEAILAVNHLAPFLLMRLFAERMDATAREHGEARIVNVASLAHYRGKIDFDNLQGERGFLGLIAYRQSKLANVMTTIEFARRWSDSPLTANCLCPGFVNTGIGAKHSEGISAAVWNLIRGWMKSPEQGAATTLYVATAPEFKGVSGKYFTDSRDKPPSPKALDEDVARRLWDISEQLVHWRE